VGVVHSSKRLVCATFPVAWVYSCYRAVHGCRCGVVSSYTCSFGCWFITQPVYLRYRYLMCICWSESESESLYDWRFTANQFVLATSPLRLTTSTFIFQLNTCCYSPYITSSLMRGRVCRYSCCWSSPAQSFSGQNPAGLMTTLYYLRFETPPTWRTRSPYIYPPGTWWPSYTPRHWVPFSSSPTNRMATVEVFDRASTREVYAGIISSE
jgi:hypothetical protein